MPWHNPSTSAAWIKNSEQYLYAWGTGTTDGGGSRVSRHEDDIKLNYVSILLESATEKRGRGRDKMKEGREREVGRRHYFSSDAIVSWETSRSVVSCHLLIATNQPSLSLRLLQLRSMTRRSRPTFSDNLYACA